MKHENRLCRKCDFKRTFRLGRPVSGRDFVIVACPRRADARVSATPRVGISVNKKVGNAVVRNRVKRLVRESIRLAYLAQLRPELDIVVVARRGARVLGYAEISNGLGRLLRRGRLLVPERRRMRS